MKEIIVIEDKEVSKVCENCGEYGEGCIMKENCKNKNTLSQTECCFNFRFTPKFKIEKCPTNWEELKELCRKLKSDRIRITKQIIYIKPTSCWLKEIRVDCKGAIKIIKNC